MIETVQFDGIEYPILSEKRTDGNTNIVKFKVMLGNEEHALQAEYSNIMLDDLRVICGINAEDELKNILDHELRLEIYQHIYQTTISEQNDKLNSLADDVNSGFCQLIASDPKFAAYIRNFHPEKDI